jgi:hypothetical protein
MQETSFFRIQVSNVNTNKNVFKKQCKSLSTQMSVVAQTLIFIVCGSSIWGAIFLGSVLGGFPVITQIDEDALNGDRSVMQFFPDLNRNGVNNRVHNVSD